MRQTHLLLLLLLICSSHMLAQVTGTKLSIEAENIELGELLTEISQQSGLNFSFSSRLIDTQSKISFSAKNESLEQVLSKLSRQLGIKSQVIEGQIVLTAAPKKRPTFHVLTGFLTDKASGESLIGATVAVQGKNIGTYTNEFGYYVLNLLPGEHDLIFSHFGYERKVEKVSISSNQRKNLALPQKSFELPEVIIELSEEDLLNQKQLGELSLRPGELNSMPEFLGESGLVKGLQTLPGISMHADGGSFYYARGGGRDQNLIVIDDAPIYNPSHLFGIYSMVMPEFSKQIDIYKSDMPAMVGDRLSSIISVRTKDGNLNEFKFGGSLSPFDFQFSLETPIKKQKNSVFATFRRSNFEWLYKRNNPNIELYFFDLHLKFNHKFNDKNRLFFTLIGGGDRYQGVNTDVGTGGSLVWDNSATTLRWNHIFNPKLFSNTTLFTGTYSNRLSFGETVWKSELGMLGLKMDFTHYPKPTYKARFGWELQGFFTTPGSITTDTTLSIFPDIQSNRSNKSVLYYQGEWDFHPKLKLYAGLRYVNWTNSGPVSYFTYDDQYQVNDTISVGEGIYNRFRRLDPRLSLQYQLNESAQFKLSYGNYHQYLQLVSNSISPFNSLDVWLPASPSLEPQSARHLSLGFSQWYKKSGLQLSTALFHKSMDNQFDFKAHPETFFNPLLEGELRFGKMRSYGAEFLVKKDKGRLKGWIAYTYSRAFRQIPEINQGIEYRAFQDRPHDLSIVMHYQLKPRIQLSAYWTTFSGSTFSSPTGFYTFNGQTIPIFGERNNDRLPTYNRFDFSFKFILHKKPTSPYQHELNFSMYNALGHRNPIALRFNRVPNTEFQQAIKADVLSTTPLGISQITFGRFLPSLSYTFKI